MKQEVKIKAQNEKKEKVSKKDKGKEKEKENKKEKKKEESDSEEDYYTQEEIKLLDKYHEFTGNKFIDDEIYDIMVRCKNDDNLIKNELKEMLKELKRGEEYNWTEIGKSNYIYFIYYF